MFAATAPLAVLPFIVARSTDRFISLSNDGFTAPPLVVGDIVVWGILAFLYIVQSIICLCSLIVATGHRKPYAFLLPIAILTVFQCCANVAWTVINYTAYVDPPNSLYPPLAAISALFANWTTALLYLAVICVVLDRRTAINAATEGQADKTHVVLIIARIVLFLLMFVLGTAYGALQTKYYQTFYSDNWTSQELFNLSETSRKVLYAFTAFFSITAIDVVASSVMLYNVAGKARVTDKMTQVMLFAISPLYVLLVIAGIVFVILFSPGGRSALATNNAFYSAVLVADIIQSVLFYSIGMVLIVMGLRRVNWVVKGGKMFNEGSAHPAHQDWQQQQPVYGQAYYPQYQYPAQPQPTPQLYSPEQAPQQLHVLQQSPQQTPPLDVQRQ